MLKGQQEALTIVLISGILIGVVGSVYFWGVPLIQKNKDIATLENSENFIENLNNKIKFVANNGGRDQLIVNVPVIARFTKETGADGSEEKKIEFTVSTGGTIYATGAEIPIGKNECTPNSGILGTNDPETICIKSDALSEGEYRTTYSLKYIKLQSELVRDFKLDLVLNPTSSSSGGEKSTIIFENKGNKETTSGGRTLVTTIVEIRII